MSPDQQYVHDLYAAHAIALAACDFRQFEFLCAFNNQVLCLLEAQVRNVRAGAIARDAIPLLRTVGTLALQIQQPFLFRAADIANVSGWCAGLAAYDGSALDLVRSALRTAHRELTLPTQPWERRRWARGKSQEQLDKHADLKRELVTATVREAYAVILVWVKVALRDGGERALEARAGALQAMDAVLGVVNQAAAWNPFGADARRALLESLEPFAVALDACATQTGHPHLPGDFGLRLASLAAKHEEDWAKA